jgi:hypothetical protein
MIIVNKNINNIYKPIKLNYNMKKYVIYEVLGFEKYKEVNRSYSKERAKRLKEHHEKLYKKNKFVIFEVE